MAHLLSGAAVAPPAHPVRRSRWVAFDIVSGAIISGAIISGTGFASADRCADRMPPSGARRTGLALGYAQPLGGVTSLAGTLEGLLRRPDRADFQADGILPLARPLRTNPRELATRVSPRRCWPAERWPAARRPGRAS